MRLRHAVAVESGELVLLRSSARIPLAFDAGLITFED
jgi:hypothetical protein